MTTSQSGWTGSREIATAGRAHRLRAALLGGLGVAALLVAAGVCTAAVIRSWRTAIAAGTVEIDQVVPSLALAVLVGCLAWSAILLAAAVIDLANRRGQVDPGSPRTGVRGERAPGATLTMRVALALLTLTAVGATTATSTSTAQTVVAASYDEAGVDRAETTPPVPTFGRPQPPARAADTPEPIRTTDSRSEAECAGPQPGWTAGPPGLQSGAARDQARLLGACAPQEQGSVVVHRGDTLWDLVARQLGPDADSEQIARAWPQWYVHNRAVIGDDPDLILPGTILTRPVTQEIR